MGCASLPSLPSVRRDPREAAQRRHPNMPFLASEPTPHRQPGDGRTGWRVGQGTALPGFPQEGRTRLIDRIDGEHSGSWGAARTSPATPARTDRNREIDGISAPAGRASADRCRQRRRRYGQREQSSQKCGTRWNRPKPPRGAISGWETCRLRRVRPRPARPAPAPSRRRRPDGGSPSSRRTRRRGSSSRADPGSPRGGTGR